MGVTLKFQRLDPFGVEVFHDLSQPLAPSEVYHLRDLFNRHGLILARGQTLTMAQQRAICAHLGPILIRKGEGDAMSNEAGGYAAAELGWHADAAYTDAPFDALSLHAIDVVDGASSTRFTSAQQAWDDLPGDIAAVLDGREQDMISPHFSRLAGRTCDGDGTDAMKRGVLPAVFTNPHNGRKCVWVSEMQTLALRGVDLAVGRRTLHAVFDRLYDEANVLEHRWCNGDLIVWDNIALQHARGNVENVGRRVLQRVIVGTQGVAPHIEA